MWAKGPCPPVWLKWSQALLEWEDFRKEALAVHAKTSHQNRIRKISPVSCTWLGILRQEALAAPAKLPTRIGYARLSLSAALGWAYLGSRL